MTHDPLCPFDPIKEQERQMCHCVLIARVREDERAAAFREVNKVIEEELWSLDPMWDGTNWNNALTCVQEAIEALGGHP